MCYKQKCKVVSLNLAHPVYTLLTDSLAAKLVETAADSHRNRQISLNTDVSTQKLVCFVMHIMRLFH